ncbi:hypothetical protein SPRG_11762 [Saprolegnia parasitica CBS 223.65]|uniref:Uncharacterized protein n=1 Tax=Saprolegnia parasitica (strain CBS 223.65) TaxID=695850 RepID=A0A067BXA8_SAPPC|nr:hypothetical protein SPRG_11762 [Saprolegnia parasitica CBS 223.65]KDO22918.1 hypothetical protein SPRG_11762 [Saprolegnia parasitica CBS 223.65]|eukprot:XP_012206355.1 hypothetical protein SPRG_11762 [Saprolegnia parasitica CBS 223.65]
MKDLATPSFWRRLGRSFRHEVDEDDGHGRRSSLFRRDPARRSFRGLFKRKDIEYDATIDGATHSTRKSLLERWLREDDPWRRESTCRLSPVELEKPAWISRCSAVQVVMCSEQPVMDGDDDDNDDATTQASDESPVTSPKQAARSNSAVLFKPTSSEYAAPLRLTSVPVAIPLIFRKRDRFYVGGKNIPFTRQNHLDRRQKHMRKAMDVVYEDCLYLDFALDPTVKNLVDYSRLLQHQRALAQAFLHAS